MLIFLFILGENVETDEKVMSRVHLKSSLSCLYLFLVAIWYYHLMIF